MMDKIFVFDREENLLTILSNKNSQACPYEDDLLTEYLAHGGSTFDFSVPMNHPDSALLQNEGYVVIKVDGEFVQFRIKQVEDTKDGLKKRVFTENASLEMLHQYVRPSEQVFLNPEETMVHILDGSRWEVGIVEVTEERQWKFTEYQNKIAALNALKTAFNARLRYRVELKGNQIVKRYVDLLINKPIRTGKRIDYRRDIVGLRRVRKSYELFTAVIPVAQDENGKLLTIKDVEWKKSQGAPVDKPKGQDWVGDEDALQKWGIGGQHIFYHYESTTAKNANDLIDEAWSFLQAHKEPQPEYDVDVVFLERLGFERDKIRLGYQIPVFDLTFNPPVLVDSTVIELRRSSTNPQNDKVILGDYKELNYRIPDSIKKLKEKLKVQKEVLDTKTKIIHSVTPPSDTTAIWVNTSVVPNIVYTYDSSLQQWVKATPTEAAEVNSYDQQTIDDKDQSVYQDSTYYADTVSQTAESNAKQHADNAAATAENNAKNYTNTYAEKKIAKGNTAPSNPAVGDLWIDTSVTPNLLKRWTGSAWQKLAPTTASEVGAVDLSTYNTKVQQLSNDIAAKADAEWVNGQLVAKIDSLQIGGRNLIPDSSFLLGTKSIFSANSATTNVVDDTRFGKALKVIPGGANAGVNSGQNFKNGTIVCEVGEKYSYSAYIKADEETSVYMGYQGSGTAKSTLFTVGTEWKLIKVEGETDSNNNRSLRFYSADGKPFYITRVKFEKGTKATDWTPAPEDIDASLAQKADQVNVYTKTEVDDALSSKVNVTTYVTDKDGIISRLNSAESRITQTEEEIATKVSNTTYQQDKTALENDISSLETRMANAESSITQTANEIALRVKQTDFNAYKATNDANIANLQTRMTNAETAITQNANQIALKANKTDVYTKTEVNNQLANKADNTTVNALETRISEAEAQLTIQANEIATKVSQTELQTAIDGIQVGGRNLARQTDFSVLPSSTYWQFRGNYTGVIDTSNTYQGHNSIKIITNGLGANGINDFVVWLRGHLPAKSDNYTISFYAKAQTGGGKVFARWGGNGSSNHVITDQSLTTNWQKFVINLTISTVGTGDGAVVMYFTTDDIINIALFKIEKGNKPTDWTPAPEDVDGAISGLDTRLSTAESSITQLSNQITLKVSQSQYDIDMNDLTSRMSSAESQISILSDEIELRVEKNGVISAINQSAELIRIQAEKIEFDGAIFGENATFTGAIKTSGTNGTVIVQNDTIKQVLGNENVTFGTFQRAYLTSGKLLVEEIYRDSSTERVIGRTTINQGSIEGINSAGSGFLLTPTSLTVGTNNGTSWSRLSIDNGKMVLDATGDIQIKKDIDLTTGVIKMPGNQAVVSGADGLYLYTDYGSGGDSYLKVKDDGAVFIVVDGAVKHSFYASGTKSGGSIVIDGKNLGMSPIDSPQILLEYIEFDIPLTPTGVKVFIEDRFRKAIENFAVFPNNGKVIEKGYDYFVIAGEGVADVRIIGKRVGYTDHFFEDLDNLLESEEISNEN
jgi:phage minor structural protein